MNTRVPVAAVGHASSLFLCLTFTLCVVWDLLFPNYAMYPAWRVLLPGFEWLSWPAFALGLLESYAYGWFFALVWVPAYNRFAQRGSRRSEHSEGGSAHSAGHHHDHA